MHSLHGVLDNKRLCTSFVYPVSAALKKSSFSDGLPMGSSGVDDDCLNIIERFSELTVGIPV